MAEPQSPLQSSTRETARGGVSLCLAKKMSFNLLPKQPHSHFFLKLSDYLHYQTERREKRETL